MSLFVTHVAWMNYAGCTYTFIALLLRVAANKWDVQRCMYAAMGCHTTLQGVRTIASSAALSAVALPDVASSRQGCFSTALILVAERCGGSGGCALLLRALEPWFAQQSQKTLIASLLLTSFYVLQCVWIMCQPQLVFSIAVLVLRLSGLVVWQYWWGCHTSCCSCVLPGLTTC